MNNIISTKGLPWNKERLQLVQDFEWLCPKCYNGLWISRKGDLIIHNYTWLFKKGMIWDSATCVLSGPETNVENLPVISLTTQSVRILWKSTLIHDNVYGHLFEAGFPFTKHDGDVWFRKLAKEAGFKAPELYYRGVKYLGWTTLVLRYLKKKI